MGDGSLAGRANYVSAGMKPTSSAQTLPFKSYRLASCQSNAANDSRRMSRVRGCGQLTDAVSVLWIAKCHLKNSF